ncbi:hypothetical protein AB0B12_08840 [Streptomyces sp. NPDC044780]|uniref:hypothetical protein n=1 Tax=unclassified Streptomyces TaxID=2593676 RepID=UPI0033CD4409
MDGNPKAPLVPGLDPRSKEIEGNPFQLDTIREGGIPPEVLRSARMCARAFRQEFDRVHLAVGEVVHQVADLLHAVDLSREALARPGVVAEDRGGGVPVASYRPASAWRPSKTCVRLITRS